MKINPIRAINQTSPPFRNSQAACLKFQKFPNPPEYHANKIIPNNKTNPKNNSIHLFMQNLQRVLHLQRPMTRNHRDEPLQLQIEVLHLQQPAAAIREIFTHVFI